MRILVVDDDALFREQFAEFLEGAGHAVTTEPSAARALDRAAEAEFDVVFTDLRMPRQSGLDLLREFRRASPRTCIILVTGYASVPTAIEAMKGGAFDYLTKPFRAQQVEEVLRLVEAERAYTESILPSRDPAHVTGALARKGTRVLILGDLPTPVPPRVERYAFDGVDFGAARSAVDAFLHDPGAAAVVIPDLGPVLARHRLEDVITFLETLRRSLRGRGPLAVGFDARQVTRDQVPALLSVLASEEVHGTLEAMDSPLRRRAIERLHEGPARFVDLMRACRLDDSPKLTFHLHRLEEAGLVHHSGERYRLTEKGVDAAATLELLEQEAAAASQRGFFFRREPPAPRPAPSAARSGVRGKKSRTLEAPTTRRSRPRPEAP